MYYTFCDTLRQYQKYNTVGNAIKYLKWEKRYFKGEKGVESGNFGIVKREKGYYFRFFGKKSGKKVLF